MEEKILVTRTTLPPFEEFANEIKKIWDTHWLTNMGEYHQILEKQLTDYLGVENISLFVNGHMALELAIQAMNLSGEVITTPYTFASTTHAIVRNGLEPVFCDINLQDYTIDVNKIESLITDRTSAIIPVHVYGNICDIEEIDRIAKKYNLKVIYDAAHAFGVKYKETGVGNFGDASMFSFHATKVYNTIEGGAVCFRDKEMGKKLYRLKNFGIRSEDIVDGIGSNAKMNEFQAIMGICNLKYIDINIEKRKRVVERYRENLMNIEGLTLLKEAKDVKSNYAYFPILVDERKMGVTRNEICDELKGHNIFARKYFYPLTNTFDCYHGQYDVNLTPNALYVSKRVLTLPLYDELEMKNVDKICNIIKSLLK